MFIDFDVFADHLKMKKTSTKNNRSNVHTPHMSSSTWGQIVDHKSKSDVFKNKFATSNKSKSNTQSVYIISYVSYITTNYVFLC